MVLEEGEYRIRGMGVGSEVEMMQSEGAGAEGTVESSAQVTIEKVVFVAPAQKKAKDALIHTTGGEINIRLCSVGVCSGGSSEQSRELKHTFLCISGGRLVLEEFELTAIAAASVPVVVVEDSGCGTIEQCLFSGVGKAHADGLILNGAQGMCEVSNTTMSGLSLSEGCGICDRGGKNMVVRNCTMSEVTATKGNGCCVRGVVSSGCALEMFDVQMVGCWTERGNGGGIHVEMEGDGSVQVGKVGKVGMKTLFEGCCARDGNEIGGYGGGVALVSKGNLSSFVVADVVFGVNEKANHASKGGDNVFVRGENLSRLITDESMQFGFDRETKATFRELEGEEVGEGGEVSAFVPLAVLVVEFRGSVHVGGESGVDYRICGLEVYPCSTIRYGCALRFGAAQASVRLMPTFVFNSKLTLAERSIEFEAAVAEEAIQIDTSGIGAEGWLVETSSAISFSRIHFSVSSSGARCSSAGLNQHTGVAAERAEHEGMPNTGGHKCVFVCAGSSLTICSCSVQMKTADAVLDAQLIRCVGGTLSISGLSMSSMTTREPLVVIDGDECAGVMEGLEIYGSKNEGEGGGSLVEIKRTKKMEMKHWRMSGCVQEDSSGLKISGGMLVEVWNVTVEELQRTRGNGGVVVCMVGEGETRRMRNCTFWNSSCEESGSKGGGVWVKTSGRSTMIFEKNKVGWCKTPGGSGVGGGVYLWFGGLEAVYSMKDLEFSENSAYQGRDVYVVCEKPRLMMNAIYWSGTASSEESSEEQKRLWVVDKEPHEYVSTSLFEYLFASVAEIVFVNKDGWSESECGFEDTPCSSVETGLGQMEAAQSIIHIKKEAPLNGTVNRGSEPLTIRGNSEKGKMSVGSGAHLEVTEGVARTTLMLSNVVVALGEGLAEAELVELRCGMAVVIDSEIVDESAAGHGGGWRIASIHGGELDMSRVRIGKMDVIGEGELFLVCGGSLKMEDSCANGVCGRGNGMIAGKEGRIVEMLNVSIAECDFENGHVATIWSGIGNATISNCTFTDCSSMSDGACVSGKIGGDMEFCVEETEMSGCRCTKEGEGKGGGMLMDMRSGRVQKYLVRDVSFEGNDACFGRNVFVECLSLNESVTADRMVLRWGSAEDDGNGYVGADSTFELITLELFLVRYDGGVVAVSNAGYDMIGCGGEQHPCFSFWQGYRNLGADYEERKMAVENGCEIAGEFDVSAMTVESASAEAEAALSFSEQWADGQVEWVLGTSSKTVLSLLHLCVPQSLSEPHRTLICCTAPSGALNISHCSFSAEHAKRISFSLITVNGGHMTMSDCTMEHVTGAAPPIVSCGGTAISNCTIKEIKCSESKEGGAVHAVLKGDWRLVMSECKMSSCSCSVEEGKGGGLFVDGSESEDDEPFLFTDVEVSLNAAHMGVNAFVVARDLNSSITRATFGFKSSRGEEEGNDFVGRDGVFGETDLYRFVREYRSTVIHISSVGGFDVMRCGSAAEPCSTFWMGMQKLEKETKMRSVRVQGELRIADGFDLTNCSVECEGSAAGEDAACNMVFDMEGDSEWDGVMCNKGELVLDGICMSVKKMGEEREANVVVNEQGSLWIRRCKMTSASAGEGQHKSRFNYVAMREGTLNVAGLEVCEVKFEGCVVQVGGGCDCVLENVVVNSIGMQSGCVLCAVDGAGGRDGMNSKIGVRVNGSKVSSVGAEGEKSSVVWCGGQGVWSVEVYESVFELCKASGSQNGGAVLFGLNEEGRLTIRDSTLLQCSCSLDSGRGGGVCIRTKNHGDLPFLFSRVVFKGNAAHVGNDVFIECYRIDKQINESQFKMDVQEGVYNRINAIYGIDTVSTSPVDLVSLITVHYSSTVVVSSSSGKGANTRQCGAAELPCRSLDYGLGHLSGGMFLTAVVDEESAAGGECDLRDVELKSRWETRSTISFDSIATQTREHVLSVDGGVGVKLILFSYPVPFPSAHETLMRMETGTVSLVLCIFESSSGISEGRCMTLMECENTRCSFDQCKIRNTRAQKLIACRNSSLNVSHLAVQNADIEADGISVADDVSMMLFNYSASHVRLRSGCMMVMGSQVQGQGQIQGEQSNGADHNFSIIFSSFSNISSAAHKPSILSISNSNNCICVDNCLFDSCSSSSFVSEVSSSASNIGTVMLFVSCTNIVCSSCVVDGGWGNETQGSPLDQGEEVCWWNGSQICGVNSTVVVKDSTICNSEAGALSVAGGSARIERGEFWNNKGSSAKYVSARRNVMCTEGGRVDVVSLKGGDGWKEDDSLWMVGKGCQMGGLASERKSAFFIPHLSEVETEETEDVGGMVKLRFKGWVLLPCSLGFEVVGVVGDVEYVEKHMFEEEDFESEREVRHWAEMEKVGWGGEEAEVRVSILFGNTSAPSHTEAFILQNKSEPKGNGDERTVEGGNGKFSSSTVIIIILVVILFIVLIVAISFIVRWKKQKRRTKELEVIVEDTVRKDPKAFEMVTMEMSPEEQWRRAEREAEKKNEERIKKRVYEKSLGHSESSEHLLSESGSTEYILGRDSDKIPQWMLEKVDEEEDDISRKRTPSPSISSTSTTDTSDTESTFVRGEDLCPTTSSMSNLVDAMACSSPHEKLIVDLRDSLFMLLHGKNEKKEMAIGTLQEREVTAAQILFWVANLALHSFDEMNNPLQSLTNLSPHIVLFSEHMVICIAMHSDCSSSDSDSSSISSSTVVTSASGDDDDDSLPSSAFEDEEDSKNECMRWKAPELLNGTTKHATKKTVVFSVGMMVWECVTLQIPFGECSGEAAGSMIVRGEKVGMGVAKGSRVRGVVGGCLRYEAEDRMTLGDVKRELIKLFPPGAAVLTMTDAIGYEEESEEACSTSLAIMASGASMNSTTCMTSMTDIGNRSRDIKKQEEVKDEANGK